MKSKETDDRDHGNDTDAFYAEVKRLREANAGKQAADMARVFGSDRIDPDPDKPQAGNGWSVKEVLNDRDG